MTTPDDKMDRRRRTNKRIYIAGGSALAVIALIVIIGAIAGGEQTDTADAAPATTTALAAPPTAPGPAVPDTRCAPAAENIVAVVAAGLTTDGHTLTNGTVINDADTTYFGATTVDAAGEMESRSDVWVIRDGAVYSATGGARNGSIYPDASEALGLWGDPAVPAVDACVVELTR